MYPPVTSGYEITSNEHRGYFNAYTTELNLVCGSPTTGGEACSSGFETTASRWGEAERDSTRQILKLRLTFEGGSGGSVRTNSSPSSTTTSPASPCPSCSSTSSL